MRITITLILALILALIVTIFAVQNNMSIEVTFLAWKINGSLALILMITFALGILIGLLVSTPAWIRRVRQSSKLKKSIRGLEKDLEQVRMASVKPSMEEPAEIPVAEIDSASTPEQEIDDASKVADA
jgi:putative membrane protein